MSPAIFYSIASLFYVCFVVFALRRKAIAAHKSPRSNAVARVSWHTHHTHWYVLCAKIIKEQEAIVMEILKREAPHRSASRPAHWRRRERAALLAKKMTSQKFRAALQSSPKKKERKTQREKDDKKNGKMGKLQQQKRGWIWEGKLTCWHIHPRSRAAAATRKAAGHENFLCRERARVFRSIRGARLVKQHPILIDCISSPNQNSSATRAHTQTHNATLPFRSLQIQSRWMFWLLSFAVQQIHFRVVQLFSFRTPCSRHEKHFKFECINNISAAWRRRYS